jgi:hypothetical protein
MFLLEVPKANPRGEDWPSVWALFYASRNGLFEIAGGHKVHLPLLGFPAGENILSIAPWSDDLVYLSTEFGLYVWQRPSSSDESSAGGLTRIQIVRSQERAWLQAWPRILMFQARKILPLPLDVVHGIAAVLLDLFMFEATLGRGI